MITQTPFGTAPDGSAISIYELASGSVRVRVTDFGATLVGIDAPDVMGNTADVVLGYGSLDGYMGKNSAFYGGTVGPVANRTDKAEVPLGGVVYHLPKNDGPTQQNNNHTSSEMGLHKRIWKTKLDESTNSVLFSCELADGELGLPGNRRFTATYTLGEESVGTAMLSLVYGCSTDAETYVNMTNHSYFNLAGHNQGRVLSQTVKIDAQDYLPLRPDCVSSNAPVPVEGTPFDFRAEKPLGQDIDADDEQLKIGRGYDHCFCVDGYRADDAPRPVFEAHDPYSGRLLSISLTTPGAHLYTGNWLDDTGAKEGANYGPRCGFAFEPEFWPDCIHHANWERPVCTPEHPYSSTIIYRFSTR